MDLKNTSKAMAPKRQKTGEESAAEWTDKNGALVLENYALCNNKKGIKDRFRGSHHRPWQTNSVDNSSFSVALDIEPRQKRVSSLCALLSS